MMSTPGEKILSSSLIDDVLELRRVFGKSQEKFAVYVNLSVGSIRSYEQRTAEPRSPMALRKLAAAAQKLNCSEIAARFAAAEVEIYGGVVKVGKERIGEEVASILREAVEFYLSLSPKFMEVLVVAAEAHGMTKAEVVGEAVYAWIAANAPDPKVGDEEERERERLQGEQEDAADEETA